MHRTKIIINGKYAPSVTEILAWPPKPWLEKWKAKWGVLAERKGELCGALGSEFNDYLDAVLWDEFYESYLFRFPRVYQMVQNVLDLFVDTHMFRPEVTQHHVVSEAYGYHGTLDAIGLAAKYDGFVIVDWKTSSSLHDDYKLQIAAYAKAYEEQHGIEIKRGYLVRVDRKKPQHEVEIIEVNLTKALFNRFLRRLKKYNERNTNECLPTP